MALERPQPDLKETTHNFTVVGIGASAGGLDAFKRFIRAIPDTSGMAYVFVQHLNPSHESVLPHLLSKETRIPVHEIKDDITIAPDNIYIIPENKILTASDGILRLTNRNLTNKRNDLIDVFFTSLAEVHKSFAVGVVLSGTATDGTAGLRAIKEMGGITFAQDKDSAAFDSMPKNAILADVVDFILPPEKIPSELVKINKTFRNIDAGEKADVMPVDDSNVYKNILLTLQRNSGIDFSHYKHATIKRHIARRVRLIKSVFLSGYYNYLRANKKEQELLVQDFLIPVTSFFRDEKIYTFLRDEVFPSIVHKKEVNEPIRIWVAACSTGQEPFSISMDLHEFLGKKADNTRIQIFATDISKESISRARSAIYSQPEVDSISQERLDKFFTKMEGGYRIKSLIRDTCIFAVHNFLNDPPFPKIDLISCRNVLMYMDPFLQKKALTAFHYSLNDMGYLILGKSESTNSASEFFNAAHKNNKIFTRNNFHPRRIHSSPIERDEPLQTVLNESKKNIHHSELQYKVTDLLLTKYTPANVVVNEHMDIMQSYGAIGQYLELPKGKSSLNLVKMAKEGLGFELRNAIHKVKKSKEPFIKENIPFNINNEHRFVTIEIVPVQDHQESHYIILFHTSNKYPLPEDKGGVISFDQIKKNSKLEIARLEKELVQAREDMGSITEDQETAYEELQNANEELLSSSEEMQTLIEELETSKEELQSGNEELITVNQELIDRQEEINKAQLYSRAIIETGREPMLFLDKHLNILHGNPAFYKKFNLTAHDTEGQFLFDLGGKNWNIRPLRELLNNILPSKSVIEDFEITHEFQGIGMRDMLLNARQILNRNNTLNLILLSFEDVTEKRIIEESIQRLEISNAELASFTYIASHDLKEPLRKIQAYSSRILDKQKGKFDESTTGYFERIIASAQRMQDLIDALFYYSKVNSSEIQFEPTDLNLLLIDVMANLQEIIEEKKVTIESGALPTLSLIPLQFNQLFLNLLTNSIKYSKPGVPVRIIISAEIVSSDNIEAGPTASKNKYWKINFEDNGIGFEQKYEYKVFELFQRLEGKKELEGTGVGLAICNKIAHNHNGFITATGVPGVGATFSIYVPFSQ